MLNEIIKSTADFTVMEAFDANNNSYLFLVDTADIDLVSKFKWRVVVEHQRPIVVTGKHTILARLLLKPSKDMEIDHKDRDTLMNTRLNLRICTRQQNTFNRGTRRKYKGVYRNNKTGNHFRARIQYNNKLIPLGTFKTEEEAARAYNKAAVYYFGEFAYLNIIS